MTIESLDDLRPGDIMISGQSTAPNKLLVYAGQLLLGEQFRIGKFAAGHAGVVTPGGRLVEAMPSGARERDLRPSDWSPQHMYFRLPEDYPGQHLYAASMARAMIGTPYSFMSYVYLAAFRFGFKFDWLVRRIDRRRSVRVKFAPLLSLNDSDPRVMVPVEAICSVLAEQAWTLTGKTVIRGTRPQVVTPGMLTKHLCGRSDIIRGGVDIW